VSPDNRPRCMRGSSGLQQVRVDNPVALCSLIKTSGEELKCFRVDLESQECTEPLDERAVSSKQSMKSLSDLLPPMRMMTMASGVQPQPRISPATGICPQLTRKQRAELGLVLACTLLQLCKDAWGATSDREDGGAAPSRKREGVWLSRDWNKAENGVCFLPGYKKLDISSPYLPVILGHDTASGDEIQQQTLFQNHSSSIVALATTLVQLQDTEVIEELDCIWQGLVDEMEGRITPTTNWNALATLLDEGEAFETYVHEKCKMAIEACLRGKLVHSIGHEDESVVKNHFHIMVVKPLADYQETLRKEGSAASKPPKKGLGHRRKVSHRYSSEDDNDEDFQDAIAFMTGQGARMDSQKWLTNLKHISTAINNTHRGCKKKLLKPPGPIKVAILDTGVNLKREFFQGGAIRAKIREIADFVVQPGGIVIRKPNKNADDDCGSIDTFGHGSLMAQFLMEAAPLADVYIARVAADTDSLSRPESKNAIVQAIKWASSQHEADVISMSFGFRDTDKSIADAITSAQLARGNAVVFLASAGNSSSERERFPAYHQDVLSIRATNCDGAFLAKRPPQDNERPGLVFGTYGDDIPDRITKEHGPEICKPGSSIATAVAAGIAAVMIAYSESLPFRFALDAGIKSKGGEEIAALEQELRRQRDELKDLQKLRTVEGMSLLFNHMAPDKVLHQRERWICPVWFFGEESITDILRKNSLLQVASGVRTPAPPSREIP